MEEQYDIEQRREGRESNKGSPSSVGPSRSRIMMLCLAVIIFIG